MVSNRSDVTVVGAERLERTGAHAAAELRDLTDTNRKAAQSVLDRATPPRDTGALDASGRVEADAESGTVTYGTEYAGVIHNGWDGHNIEAQPWLADQFNESTASLTDIYVDHLADVLHTIHGA